MTRCALLAINSVRNVPSLTILSSACAQASGSPGGTRSPASPAYPRHPSSVNTDHLWITPSATAPWTSYPHHLLLMRTGWCFVDIFTKAIRKHTPVRPGLRWNTSLFAPATPIWNWPLVSELDKTVNQPVDLFIKPGHFFILQSILVDVIMIEYIPHFRPIWPSSSHR